MTDRADGTIERPGYAALAPRGDGRPAREAWIVFDLPCAPALRAPLSGLARETNEQGELIGCVAQTPEAAREVARRAAIDALPNIGVSGRLVWLRALPVQANR